MDVILASAQKQQLTIFIDALDEAGDQSAREVARYFHAVNDRIDKASGTARICISCRHYPIPSNVKSIEISVEEYNYNDINAFVRGNIKLDDLVIREPDELEKWQDVVYNLVQQARGVFQWASLVVPLVERSISDGDSPEDVSQWLHQVPGDLEGVYKHILRDVIEERYRAKSLRLFQWVCLAACPLSLEELRYALASHDISLSPRITCTDTKDFIKSDSMMALRVKSWSGGLLEVSNSSNGVVSTAVQVIHQSVDDFFMEKGFSFLAELVNPDEGACYITSPLRLDLVSTYYGHLYWCCLSYIAVDPDIQLDLDIDLGLDSIPLTESAIKNWEKADAAHKLMQQRYPFLVNAIANVLPLAKKAGEYRSGDLQEELNLLGAAIPGWLMASVTDILGGIIDIYYCSTPLHVAAAADMKDLTQFLIQKCVVVDVTNKAGWTPLHLAIKHGHLGLAKMLTSANANINSETQERMTPLLIAASHGHTDIFNWLLDLGASVSEVGSENPLHVAAEKGHVLMVRLCLEVGIDVNAQGGFYGNALQAASCHDHENVVNILLQAGANVHAEGGYYGNALQAASCRSRRESLVHILLQAGAIVNSQGGRFGNALQAASVMGKYKICIALIEAGADVNAQGGYYGTALQAAVSRWPSSWRQVRVVEILLQAGADVNANSAALGTALEGALQGDEDDAIKEIIRLLIEAGARKGSDKTSESDTA